MTNYSDDMLGLRQTAVIRIPASTNGANEVIARIVFFTKTKVLEARAAIISTAFDEGDCALNIYKDDGSIGAIAVTTATEGQIVDASLTDTTFDTTNSLEIQQASATSTGVCDLMIQYQEMFE